MTTEYQADLFGDGHLLPSMEQAALDRVVQAVADGSLTQAHVEALMAAGETSDGVLRERFDRLGAAVWDARNVISAWATVEKWRKAA